MRLSLIFLSILKYKLDYFEILVKKLYLAKLKLLLF